MWGYVGDLQGWGFCAPHWHCEIWGRWGFVGMVGRWRLAPPQPPQPCHWQQRLARLRLRWCRGGRGGTLGGGCCLPASAHAWDWHCVGSSWGGPERARVGRGKGVVVAFCL